MTSKLVGTCLRTDEESIRTQLPASGQRSWSWLLSNLWLQILLTPAKRQRPSLTESQKSSPFTDWSSSFLKGSFSISCAVCQSVLMRRSVCPRFDSLSPLATRENCRHPSLQHAMTAPHACMKEIDFYIWPNPGGYFSVTDSIFSKRAGRYIRTRRDRCDDL